ncbi:glycosyltransferase family 39 protein [Stieleria sp. TO1_6]|uniref:glycosyltransferase family 39 protein n=1 Tax=Stieleria tagensis TaxID=2956795 RepID=UPI00209A65BB|nr:glycosyltransferase family 39 protein [Stieleria tagensis]MCO8125151.1 glycosyltransferase family 39 protein [Stieleria tagensis]
MNSSDRIASGSIVRLIVLAVVAVTLAAASGRLVAHAVNDTPSYLEYPFGSLTDALLSIRTPGYPLFLALAKATVGIAAVPLLQLLLHTIASWMLGEELIARKMPIRSALAAAFCVLLGCTASDHISTLATDAPAVSLAVITAVLLMRSTRTRSTTAAIGCGLLAIVTIFVRPAYLFLIPWLAVTGWLLANKAPVSADRDPPQRTGRWLGMGIAVAVGLVVLSWMTLRKSVVNDFGILPFGHQNLSAILVQTVPTDRLRHLDGPGGELAKRVAEGLTEGGYELPVEGGGPLPTLTLESQWGDINYNVIWPLAKQLEQADEQDGQQDARQIRVHRRIGAMNRAILADSPRGYVLWLGLALRRAAWGTAANLTMHPLFLASLLAGMGWLLYRATAARPIVPLCPPAGWAALVIVGITFVIFNDAFVILTSPPIGRFADAAAIFLPAIIASLVVGWESQA